MDWILLKVLIPLMLVAGALYGVNNHFKHDKQNEQDLGAARQEIAQLKADKEALTQEIVKLNEEKTARNNKLIAEVLEAEENAKKAKIEANAARNAKRQSDIKLAEAQRKYREALNGNENIQIYSNNIIPDAVLDRLRSANGEAGRSSDSMRGNISSISDFQTITGRTIAWVRLSEPPS